MGFLVDQGQFVSLKGFSSAVKLIAHGVPQGSVLGPLLFSIVIVPEWS